MVEVVVIKLTAAQETLLRKIVATNGGGVHAGFNESCVDTKIIRRLESLGLVQGKSGRPGWAVHTRDGLAWVRETDKARAAIGARQ